MNMRIFFLLLLSVMSLYCSDNSLGEWTWVYRKNFTERDCNAHKKKQQLIFMQEDVSPFTQLILSWNAFRPQEGYFSFYVQVRDALTNKWGIWHHVADWGDVTTQSFLSKSDGFSSHVYVRLEIDDKKYANAFRIKIESRNAANLSLVRSIIVAFSDFNFFKSELCSDIQNLSSVCLVGMPSIAQFALEHEDKGRICSPVSCSMVVQFIMGNSVDPLDFAAKAFDAGLGVYGSWPCNMAHAFERCEGKFCFFVRRMNSFKDIHFQLMQGLPVIVSVRGVLPGAFKPFPHGHLMIVVGWDNETREVLCHDPACEKNYEVFKRYPLESFLPAWERSHRLAYVVEPVK